MLRPHQAEGARRLLSDRRRQGGLSIAQFGIERRAGHDRRASPRVPIQLGCEGETYGSWFYRLSFDISLTGVSLASGLPYATGTEVSLRLLLPDGREPLTLSAQVVGRFDRNGGMRLRFHELSSDQTFRLASGLLLLADTAVLHAN